MIYLCIQWYSLFNEKKIKKIVKQRSRYFNDNKIENIQTNYNFQRIIFKNKLKISSGIVNVKEIETAIVTIKSTLL